MPPAPFTPREWVDLQTLADELRQGASSAPGEKADASYFAALRDSVDLQQKQSARRHVIDAFASSVDEFDPLYRKLAEGACLACNQGSSPVSDSAGAQSGEVHEQSR